MLSAEDLSHKMASNFFVWENCKDLTKYKVMNPAGDATVLTNFFTPESCSDHRSHKPHCCNHAGSLVPQQIPLGLFMLSDYSVATALCHPA